MTFTAGVRKLWLALHLLVSVGWIGAVVAYLVLDLTAAAGRRVLELRAAYAGMDLIARRAIVPFALASLVTGIVVAMGSRWGLFRHWWVLISLILTSIATVVLLSGVRTIGRLADVASDPATGAAALRALPSTLPHSIGGLVVLVVVLGLNVAKPRGLTRYGWRKQQAGLA